MVTHQADPLDAPNIFFCKRNKKKASRSNPISYIMDFEHYLFLVGTLLFSRVFAENFLLKYTLCIHQNWQTLSQSSALFPRFWMLICAEQLPTKFHTQWFISYHQHTKGNISFSHVFLHSTTILPYQKCCISLQAFIIITIIYLPWSWATCWPVPVSRIQKSLQRSTMIPSASWWVVFHYPG
jgi:hypothetical protein